MKKLLLMLLCATLSAAAQLPSSGPNTNFTFTWDYPTNYWVATSNQMQTVFTNKAQWPAITNMVYRVYSNDGTNLTWNLVGTVTNQYSLNTTVPPFQQQFFTLSVSNFLGSAFFSGVAGTPLPPPNQGNFILQSSH